MIRDATIDDLPRLKQLHRRDQRALGFIPMSKKTIADFRVFEHEFDGVIAYMATSRNLAGTQTTIRQLVVEECHRRKGIGRRMVQTLEGQVRARVRADLEANLFWEYILPVTGRELHKTSHTLANIYQGEVQ